MAMDVDEMCQAVRSNEAGYLILAPTGDRVFSHNQRFDEIID